MNEMLLRGCMLKNSNYVLGLVVYTGQESRIQMNAAKTPNKVGGHPCLQHSTIYMHACYKSALFPDTMSAHIALELSMTQELVCSKSLDIKRSH